MEKVSANLKAQSAYAKVKENLLAGKTMEQARAAAGGDKVLTKSQYSYYRRLDKDGITLRQRRKPGTKVARGPYKKGPEPAMTVIHSDAVTNNVGSPSRIMVAYLTVEQFKEVLQ